MPIYSKSARLLMKEDMLRDLAPSDGAVFTKKQAVDWFSQHYPKIKTGTITAHLICLSTNAPSRVHYNAKEGDDDVFFQLDGSHFRRYEPSRDPLPIYKSTEKPRRPGNGDDDDDEPVETSDEFAYESDLKHYLAKNLAAIEPGLRLYEDEGITGIEFPAGGRFIDILAVDANNSLVVIELKVSRGYDRVVGQLMRYMAWIGENQADSGQSVRGVIVARQITGDLKLACSLLKDVKLYEYELSIAVKQLEC